MSGLLIKTRSIIPRFCVSQLKRSSSSYKSDINIESLYPSSSQSHVKHEDIVQDLVNKAGVEEGRFSGYIPVSEISVSHSKTSVELRFHVDSAQWLSSDTRNCINQHLGRELSRDGWLIVRSDRTTSRTLNMADALEKLRANIRAAENPVDDSYPKLELEQQRKAKLKAARERLHIKV